MYRTNVKKPGLKSAFQNLFHAEHLEKLAVDSLSFSMEKGEAMACLGENGAGKSTLIKMLVGILTPTQGSILVGGQNPFHKRKEYLEHIGVIFGQKTNLWWEIPVIESYRAAQVLYKIPMGEYKRSLELFTDLLELGPLLSIPARKLSLGQRMKADIAMAFLHDPDILFLDEPTIGLDIHAKNIIRKFIRQINQEKKTTVLLTSHDLDDIEQICDTALILSKGKAIYRGSLSGLKAEYAPYKVLRIKGIQKQDITALVPPGVEVTQREGTTLLRYDYAKHQPGELLEHIVRCFQVEDISVEEAHIEDVVEQIYRTGAWEAKQ